MEFWVFRLLGFAKWVGRVQGLVMKPRVLVTELLDELPPGDPEAIRSRRDLRLINFLMGNERWIVRAIRRFPEAVAKGIVELGAGDGALCQRLAREFSDVRVVGCDLVPRPLGLDGRVEWRQGDVLDGELPRGGVLVMNLFLHHFEGDALECLLRHGRAFDLVVFNEPNRARLPHVLGGLMHPLVNRVTRHDLHTSLRAGFRRGEISGMMKSAGNGWDFRETSTWRGAVRVLGWRV